MSIVWDDSAPKPVVGLKGGRVCTRQPPMPVINWDAPITNDLVFAYEGSAGLVDLVTGAKATQNAGNTRTSGKFGLQNTFSGWQAGNSCSFGKHLGIAGATQLTIEVLFYYGVTNASPKIFSQWNNSQRNWLLQGNSTDLIWVACDDAGGNRRQWNMSGALPTVGWYHVILSWLGESDKIAIINGVDVTGALAVVNAIANKHVSLESQIDPLQLGVAINGPLTGSIVLARLWRRGLTLPEAQTLSANPWQIFQAQPLLIPFEKSEPIVSSQVTFTGQTLTYSQGTVSSSRTTLVTGQSATFSQGTVGVSIGSNVTVSLVGQAVTFSQGTIQAGAPLTLAVSGQSVTVSQGSFGKSTSVQQAGQAFSYSLGITAPAVSRAVTGQAVSYSLGVSIPSLIKVLTGQALSLNQGTLTPNRTTALTGQSLTFSQGTISTSVGANVTVSLTGQAVTFSQGTVSPSAPKTVALSGQAFTVTSGQISHNRSKDLTGQQITVSQGTIATTAPLTLSLTGQEFTFTQGSISAGSPLTVGLVGYTLIVSQGSLGKARSANLPSLDSPYSHGFLQINSAIDPHGVQYTIDQGSLIPTIRRASIGASALVLKTNSQGHLDITGHADLNYQKIELFR